MKKLSPTQLCDRDKRDLRGHYSDDATEEDFQLFKQTPHLRDRIRREVIPEHVSKENATRYCAERISETKIGKLCAKVGVNVQALVNTCSSDIEVSTRLLSCIIICPVIGKFGRLPLRLHSMVVERKLNLT